MKIDFSADEKRVVEESFMAWMNVLTVIARLHNLNPTQVQLAPDRSGFEIPDPPEK